MVHLHRSSTLYPYTTLFRSTGPRRHGGAPRRRRGPRAPRRHRAASDAASRTVSFVPQRLHGIEQRGLARGIVPEEYTHGDGERGRDDDRVRGQLDGPAQGLADEDRGEEVDEHSARTADQTEHHGLAQKLQLDRLLPGSDGDAQADLTRALGD